MNVLSPMHLSNTHITDCFLLAIGAPQSLLGRVEILYDLLLDYLLANNIISINTILTAENKALHC